MNVTTVSHGTHSGGLWPFPPPRQPTKRQYSTQRPVNHNGRLQKDLSNGFFWVCVIVMFLIAFRRKNQSTIRAVRYYLENVDFLKLAAPFFFFFFKLPHKWVAFCLIYDIVIETPCRMQLFSIPYLYYFKRNWLVNFPILQKVFYHCIIYNTRYL